MEPTAKFSPECPSQDDLRLFAGLHVLGQRTRTIAQHVKQCSQCAGMISRITSADALTAAPHGQSSPAARDGNQDGMTVGYQGDSSVPSTATTPPEAADRIGEYETLVEIAKGGMGVVYKARHRRLGRIAALKMIRSGEFANNDEIKRFHIEAAAAAQLDHPNIVPVFEAGEHRGRHFMALAFVDGPSLWSLVKDRPLEPLEAARLMEHIARAIHYAHEKGIVHRDLKPQNVLLAPGGVPKVTDFGLAKRTEQHSEMTGDGTALGTPSYMPPEQAAGRVHQIGPLSDVYSLGATLYALVCGRPPFQAANPLETLKQVLDCEPVSPRTLNPSVPLDLETICLKALQKDPQQRYTSAKELADDLGRFTRSEPILARPVGRLEQAWLWGQRNRALAVSLLAIFLTLVGGTTISTLLAIRANYYYGEAKIEAKKASDAGEEKAKAAVKAIAERDRANTELYYASIAREEGRIDDGHVVVSSKELSKIPFGMRRWEFNYLARRTAGTPLTFYGHNGPVRKVAYGHDGSYVVTAGPTDQSYMGTTATTQQMVKWWDVKTGAELRSLGPINTQITILALNSDGTRLATGGEGNSIVIWDTLEFKPVQAIKGLASRVSTVAFSPDGTRLVSGGVDKTVRIWDLASGKETFTGNGHKNTITCVAFSPDGLRVASASTDNTARVWNCASGASVELSGHTKLIWTVAFNPDGVRLVTASEDFTCRTWEVATGKHILTFTGHGNEVFDAVFSPDGRYIASGGYDNVIRIWDSFNGHPLVTHVGHEAVVGSVSFSPDGTRVVSGAYDGTAKIWHTPIGSEAFPLVGHTKTIHSVAVSPDGRTLASGSFDATIRLWNLATGAVTATLTGHENSANKLAFSADGRWLASGSIDNTIKFWNVKTGVVVHTFRGHTDFPLSVAITPDGRRVLTASNDRTVKCWNTDTGELDKELFRADREIYSAVISPDCRWLVIGAGHLGPDGFSMTIHDLSTGHQKTIRAAHQRSAGLAFSPDSKRLASHSGDHTVKLWDPATGQELANLVGHQREVYTVAFHPDGSRIATTGPDGFVKIWNTQTGVELLNLRNDPEKSTGTALVFTPDGNRLASGHWNGLVRIADARVRGETQRVVAADRKIVGVALSQGKPELLAKLDSGDFAAWNLETGQPVENKVLPIDVKEFVNSDQRWYAMLDGGGARLTKIHDGYDPWSEDEATREQWSAAWHTKHLGWTESAREWFGTTFHLKRLIALKPTRQAVGDARFATDEELHADYAARLKYAEEQWAMFRNAVLPPDVPR